MTEDRHKKVAIVPCSGIGKTYGAITREAAFQLIEDLRPGSAEVVALSLLVLGDEETRARIQSMPTIAVDGCKLACASKMLTESGAPAYLQANVMDTFRRHRGLRPKGVSTLNPDARELSRLLAEELADMADSALAEEES